MYVCMCGVLLKGWFEKKERKKFKRIWGRKIQNKTPSHIKKTQLSISVFMSPPPFSMAPATTTSLKSPLDRRRSKDPARELFDETDVPVLEEFTLEQFDMLEALLLFLL